MCVISLKNFRISQINAYLTPSTTCILIFLIFSASSTTVRQSLFDFNSADTIGTTFVTAYAIFDTCVCWSKHYFSIKWRKFCHYRWCCQTSSNCIIENTHALTYTYIYAHKAKISHFRWYLYLYLCLYLWMGRVWRGLLQFGWIIEYLCALS